MSVDIGEWSYCHYKSYFWSALLVLQTVVDIMDWNDRYRSVVAQIFRDIGLALIPYTGEKILSQWESIRPLIP